MKKFIKQVKLMAITVYANIAISLLVWILSSYVQNRDVNSFWIGITGTLIVIGTMTEVLMYILLVFTLPIVIDLLIGLRDKGKLKEAEERSG